MLGAAARGIGKGFMGAARVPFDAFRTKKDRLGTVLGAGMVIGSMPILGGLARSGTANVTGSPLVGELAFGDMVGTSRLGETGNYAGSRSYAANIKRNPMAHTRYSGLTTRGLASPRRGNMKSYDKYGNPEGAVKAAHALKEKLASSALGQYLPTARITAPQLALAAAGATAGGLLARQFIGGSLNKLEELRRDAGKQTNMKRTMKILHAVNPEVREDPQMLSKAQALYGIVHRTSPYVAKEPVVAASVINTMLYSPSELPTPDAFKALVDLQEKKDKIRSLRPYSDVTSKGVEDALIDSSDDPGSAGSWSNE